MFSLFPVLLLVLSAQASTLTLKNPRFTVSDSIGSQIRSETISLENKPSTVVELSQTDILKITFQVVDDTNEGVQPHQTFLRFYDEISGEEGIQPIRVTPGGKAKFELKLSKPPLSLPPTPKGDPLRVTLIIGSSLHDPLSVELFDLILPPSLSAPEHPDAASYHPLPEINHTFRPDHKVPPRFISAVSAALVVTPWVILLSLWSQVAPRLTHLFSLNILPFILCLGAFEGLLYWYWVDLKLGQVLLYGAILSIPTIFAGKSALTSIGSRRVGRN